MARKLPLQQHSTLSCDSKCYLHPFYTNVYQEHPKYYTLKQQAQLHIRRMYTYHFLISHPSSA